MQSCLLSKINLQATDTTGLIVCEDVFNSSFKENAFDIIYSGGLIEHFEDPTTILKKMNILLKPDGILIASVPNLSSIYRMIQRRIDKKNYEKHHHISIKQISEIYEYLGFKVEKVRYIGYIDIFSISWEVIIKKSSLFRNIILPILKIFNVLLFILQKMLPNLRSKLFCPFIISIGIKKSSKNRI